MTAFRDYLGKQCACAVWTKCPHAWTVEGRFRGTMQSVSLDKFAKLRGLVPPRLKADAEVMRDEVVRQLQTGTYERMPTPGKTAPVAAAVEGGLTFDQAVTRFATTVLDPQMASLADELGRYRKLGAVTLDGQRFGDLPVTAITEDQVEAVYAAVTTGKANHTKRKYRRGLTRLLRWCVTKKHLVASPITEATVLRAGTGVMRTRRVRPEEEANLLAAAAEGRSGAAQRLVALIIAALDLGCRLGELLALQWRDIDRDTFRVTVRAAEAGARKSGKGRQVPLTVRALETFDHLARLAPTAKGWGPTDYVFGDAIGGRVTKVRKAWVTTVLRAHNVQPAWTGTALAADVLARFQSIDLHFHDLRHEAALRWLEMGLTLGTIAKLLGHANLDTLRVYLGVEQEDALAEAERAYASRQPIDGKVTVKRRYFGRSAANLVAAGKEVASGKSRR
jgi:integrase